MSGAIRSIITNSSAMVAVSSLDLINTQLSTASSVASFLTATETFTAQVGNVGAAMNPCGAVTNEVNSEITFDQNKISLLNSGLGALVDADMAYEPARLRWLRIQQQLGPSALSIADQ